MAITVTHKFVSSKGDIADSSYVRPTNWNDTHNVTGLVEALGYTVGMSNGTFVVTAGSSALTIALKTLAGADPSASDPVYFFFRNVTGTTGDFSISTITAASSIVVSSGLTLGVTSSTAFRLWIVGFNDGGTFRLGVINCATNTQVFPLVEGIASSTAEGGAGAADSAGVIYTGTAVTSKAMRILGYAEWSASGLTAGTWTTTNLIVTQLFGPGIKKPGDIVQTITFKDTASSATTSSTPAATTTTVDLGLTSAANLVNVSAAGPLSDANSITSAALAFIYAASTAIAGGAGQVSGAVQCAMVALYKPNTTASTTYQVRIASTDNATTISWNLYFSLGSTGNIILQEIMG